MKQTRVLIIGFDGLDPSLVEEFNFEDLKQNEWGKVDLRSFPVLATPLIWPSFITGLTYEKHKISGFAHWDFEFLNFLREILIKLGFYAEQGSPLWIDKIAEAIGLLGFKARVHSKRDLDKRGIKTIFDYFDDSIAVNVPSYNEPPIYQTLRLQIKRCFEDPRFEKSYEQIAWQHCKDKLDSCLELLKSKWRLFMVHFFFTDQLGHLWRGDLAKMFRVYYHAANIVRTLKEKVSESTYVLVISDHGMKPQGRYGLHSPYGFYSSNKVLGLKNPRITEFVPLILQTLRETNREK